MKNYNLKLKVSRTNKVSELKIVHLHENVVLTGQMYKIVFFKKNVIIFHFIYNSFRAALDSSKYV
jgi:hypothetical protein